MPLEPTRGGVYWERPNTTEAEDQVQVGTQRLSETHTLVHFPDVGKRGCWACTKCGYYTQISARKLASACVGELNHARRHNLATLRRGFIPSGDPQALRFNQAKRRTMEDGFFGRRPSELFFRGTAEAEKGPGKEAADKEY